MWKDIKDWEDKYEINELGEVRNKNSKHIIKAEPNPAGYFRVCLYDSKRSPCYKKYFVHRLVAETFLPNPENLPEVNHLDNDISHNYLSNLEWSNKLKNELQSHKTGRKPYRPFKVIFQNGTEKIYDVKPDLARELNLTRGQINHWLRGLSVTYINYGIKDIFYI